MKRGYGLALVKGSPYLAGFNRALRTLRRSGQLDELRQKWWSRNEDCSDTRRGRGSGVRMSRVHDGVDDDDGEGGDLWTGSSSAPSPARIEYDNELVRLFYVVLIAGVVLERNSWILPMM